MNKLLIAATICFLVCATCVPAASTFAEDTAGPRELALQPPQVFIKPDESQYSSSRRMFQGIPGIERAPNGRLWVSRFSGSTGEGASSNYGLLITSGDDGRTWSDLKVVVDVPGSRVRICDPCLWIDPLGRLWFFWCQAYGPWVHCGVWAMVTESPDDANPEWSEPRRLCEGVMLNKPTVLAGGDWLFPVNVKKDLSEYQWPAGEEPPTNIVVMASGDQGATFTRRGAAPVAPEDDRHIFSEPMIGSRQLWLGRNQVVRRRQDLEPHQARFHQTHRFPVFRSQASVGQRAPGQARSHRPEDASRTVDRLHLNRRCSHVERRADAR